MAGFDVDPALAASMRDSLAEVAGPAVEDDVIAAREVGEALRRVIDRLTATSAPPDVLRQVVAQLAPIEEVLRPYGAVRSYKGAAEASGLGAPPGSGLQRDTAFFDWSPLLGLANPLAPPMPVAVEGDMIVGHVRFGIAYEGPPGCVHGGFIAAAFDELLGLTQSLSGKVGMTGTLTVKYRKPTPLHTDLRIEGRVESVNGRKVLTNGRMLAGDMLTAEATGLFISIAPEDFRAWSAQREQVPEP
ncbi:MAG TPA: PaaI family thioesterase [Acidimicrobiales bacterium]|jgi:acyl-coenzyme A thioesterase PaaI-like protein|nr:PaaI family thioesterase [Acidimicrobiales bacterium]